MIYRLSGGIPRSINLLCQAALVYGFADEVQAVDQTIIKQISEDKIGIGLQVVPRPKKDSNEPDSTFNVPRKVFKRLRNLETEIQDTRSQLANQIQELAEKVQGSKKDLVVRLNQLLEDERARNSKLRRKYTRLKMRYEALRRIGKRQVQEPDRAVEGRNSKVQSSDS